MSKGRQPCWELWVGGQFRRRNVGADDSNATGHGQFRTEKFKDPGVREQGRWRGMGAGR